ncbi:hypothetical protein Q4E40_09685 [Pontibacter sp. BT731]|uniref:hypothetical protein n=1 Tax=Pontibacter coccineus TaxID=3063328 RepID=UPI0026E3391D|nr:hypothetical protein [Pontibacter sp. BT731]MDO6390397.1 hypothetical protein [Pontibacter sp. BT731]
MHTTTFKFEEGSPYVGSHRPVGLEIHERLMWQVRRLHREDMQKAGWELIIYTPIPAYLEKPATIEVYWDYDNPEESCSD